ncbi:MAG: alpha/beta hydrolase [Rhodobacteraceae bacterium]|nr:MAG: alpha/beta hydrolase [Paracoccaceae bacterium]
MILSILNTAAIFALVSAGIALGLIVSDPARGVSGAGGLDFSGVGDGIEMPEPMGVRMRDGFELAVREYENDQGPLIILIHGSGWNGLQFNGLAARLNVGATVLVPDLRGHGAQPGRRGDVDYIGQLEDDLADLIKARARPGQKVVMLGHSSGGGLVVRFAGGAHGGLLDGAVLLAPFLKYNAPTTRANSGGWAAVQTRRLIGLSMLNAVGIRALNYLGVISFKMPDAVMDGPLGHLATTSYSFRMNVSYAPRMDYLKDISALPPFLLMVGDRDEAFIADQYEPLMRQVTDMGRYLIAKDTGHLGIVDAPGTAPEIQAFLDAL